MNRKLHNSLLAFSITGLMLTMGLMAAGPAPQPADPYASNAPRIADAMTVMRPVPLEAESAAVEARARSVEARIEARADAFAAMVERDPQANVGGIIAGALALAGEISSEVALAKVLETTDSSPPDSARRANEARVRHDRRIRSALAVPYFSFAQGLRRGAGS